MKQKRNFTVLVITSLCTALLGSCGGGDNAGPPPDPIPNSISPTNLGAVHFSCKGSNTQAQQQQSPYQQQQGCYQKFRFDYQKVSDFDVNLDCDQGIVKVQNRRGPDSAAQEFPISADGTIDGQMQFQQSVKDDGRGQVCWVEYVVDFGGKANCDPDGKKALSLDTSVSFSQTDSQRLQDAGIVPSGSADALGPGLSADPAPSSSLSPSPSPSPSKSVSPSPSASPSPSGSPAESSSPAPNLSITPPAPMPSISVSPIDGYPPEQPEHPHHHPDDPHKVIPIIFCQVPQEPCEMKAQTDLLCPN